MRMTKTQAQTFIELFAAAENTASEEREFWNDQTVSEDHRPPSWLPRLEEAVELAKRDFGFKWKKGRGWVTSSPSSDGPVSIDIH